MRWIPDKKSFSMMYSNIGVNFRETVPLKLTRLNIGRGGGRRASFLPFFNRRDVQLYIYNYVYTTFFGLQSRICYTGPLNPCLVSSTSIPFKYVSNNSLGWNKIGRRNICTSVNMSLNFKGTISQNIECNIRNLRYRPFTFLLTLVKLFSLLDMFSTSLCK